MARGPWYPLILVIAREGHRSLRSKAIGVAAIARSGATGVDHPDTDWSGGGQGPSGGQSAEPASFPGSIDCGPSDGNLQVKSTAGFVAAGLPQTIGFVDKKLAKTERQAQQEQTKKRLAH